MWGKLLSALVAAVAAKVPKVISDLWERYRPKSKDTLPPEEESPAVEPTPAVEPEEETVGEDESPKETTKVRELKLSVKCRPADGQYLIDESGECVCGKGQVVGVSWIRRPWPPAQNGAYHYVTRKRDNRTGYVQWTPKLLESGEYTVYVRVPATSNRTSKAIYLCMTDTGPVRAELDQRGYIKNNIMRWQMLGRWHLNKENCFLRLLNSGGHSEGADSAAFVKT